MPHLECPGRVAVTFLPESISQQHTGDRYAARGIPIAAYYREVTATR